AGGLLLQALLLVGVAAAPQPALPAVQEVGELVAGDGVQPGAEGAAVGVVLQAPGGPGDGAQDLLHQVGSVGVLEPAVAGEAGAERGVAVGELPPGLAVAAVPDANQQAGPGRR